MLIRNASLAIAKPTKRALNIDEMILKTMWAIHVFFEKVAAPRCGMCGTSNQHKSNIVLNTVASASESSEESSHNERGTLCFATDVYEAGDRSAAGSTACIAGIVPLGRTLRCRRLCLLV